MLDFKIGDLLKPMGIDLGFMRLFSGAIYTIPAIDIASILVIGKKERNENHLCLLTTRLKEHDLIFVYSESVKHV